MKTSRVRYIFDSKGKKTDVILPLANYERLLEDLHDLAIIAERKNEDIISLEEAKRRLSSRE